MEFLSGNDWEKYLSNITEKRRTKKLFKLVDEAYSKYNDEIFPEKENLFKAFEKTSFEDTKVVIVGQDPYPNKKATGLAFSIPKGTIETNDSMTQILAELKRETGIERKNRNIESWSDQGVLLLNKYLTKSKNKKINFNNRWTYFTRDVIKKLSEKEHVVFILWGKRACGLEIYIDKNKNKVIKGGHPSNLSTVNRRATCTFKGKNYFTETNKYLTLHNISTINWKN